jgi:methionine synthase / methylenetetrahydrofolate reductase(NADPH)
LAVNLLEELEDRPLCGDGAMGTLLIERGVPADQCLEELCLSHPELIGQIHRDYVQAGARIIETNTFGANAVRLAAHGLAGRVNEINWQAVQLARQSAGVALVAGSVGPLGVSSEATSAQETNHEECFRTQIGALLDSGVDLICLETFQDLDELLLALRVKQALHHCPAICSLTPNKDGHLPDGMSLADAFAALARADADILAINCVYDPKEALRLVEQLSPFEAPLAVFPNAGLPHLHQGGYLCGVSPEEFAKMGSLMLSHGVRILGGCCGTTPAHIADLAKVLAEESATKRC